MDIGRFVSYVACLFSDDVLFPLFQLLLSAFAVFCWLIDRFHRWRANREARPQPGIIGGTVTATVTRGNESMAIFYGTYAALTGLAVSLSLTVDVAKAYRVFCVLWDTLLIAYLCLLSIWFRNKLIALSTWLKSVEKR